MSRQWKPKKLPKVRTYRNMLKEEGSGYGEGMKEPKKEWMWFETYLSYRFVECKFCKKDFKRIIQAKGYNPLPHICNSCFEKKWKN